MTAGEKAAAILTVAGFLGLMFVMWATRGNGSE
jgi:hypothetical protein